MGGDFHAARCVPTFIEITERTEIGRKFREYRLGCQNNNAYICRKQSKRYMPKIFEYFGFIFYFYSNEHEPIHVHVMHGGKV